MAGRPPLPTNIKVLQGTFRPSRAVEEPKPEELKEVPRPPKTLSSKTHKRARSEWTRISKELVDLGLLTKVDFVALECYCLAYERMLTAEEALADGKGLTTFTPNGFEQQRPEVSIASVSRKEVREFLIQFGMTPASRSRINVKKKKEGEGDKMEELLRAGS